MNSFILYLVEASLVLAVLYAAYRLLLSKETFFAFNRFFLMAILVLSLLFPLVSFELSGPETNFINQQSTELGKARNSYHTSFENWSEWPGASTDQPASWWQRFSSQEWDQGRILMVSAMLIYCIGFGYRVLKLSLGYVRIYLLKRKLSSTELDGLKVSEVPANMAPFSFLNTVFIPESIDDEKEYGQILAHEKTHIQQKHSLDLIFVQLVAAFLWFNPVVWLLIKSLKQTHEYIADKNMLQQGFSLVEYQSLLLRQLISNNSYGLVHNFNLSFIKKRITMMSIKKSGWIGKSKAVVALSAILLIGLMTAQSNTMLGTPAGIVSEVPKGGLPIKFYIDGISLSDGLQFSKLRNYKGKFTFNFPNGEDDNIHVGLDLMRNGKTVASASLKLKEVASVDIKALLIKAEKDDFLVIDIIEGPTDAAKLYNIPLFREGEGRKKSVNSDLPPPPPSQVALFVDGTEVSPQKGVSLSELKARGFKANLEYKLSEFVDFGVVSRQDAGVEVSLMRGEQRVRVMVDEKVERKDSFDISTLLKAAKKGDEIMVLFGKQGGLQFGSKFAIE